MTSVRWFLFCLQLGSLVTFAATWQTIHGFPLDDAWIHQVVGRTFAETGTLGYAAGHHGAAATSYLWAALQALNHRLFAIAPALYALGLNASFSLGCGQALFGLLRPSENRRDRSGDRFARWQIALAVGVALLGGNFVWFAFSGMEASLFSVLSMTAIALHARPEASSRVSLLVGVCCGLLALCRPEGALLGPLLALLEFAKGQVANVECAKRRRWRRAFLILLPWGVAVAGYALSNLIATGIAWPSTLGGRRWLWMQENAGLSPVLLRLDFITAWFARLRDYTLGSSSMLLFWSSLALSTTGLVLLAKRARRGFCILLLWTGIHFATYFVLMPTHGHGGRYQPIIPLLYLLGVAFGATTFADSVYALIAKKPNFRLRAALLTLFNLPWIVSVLTGFRDWRTDHASAVAHIQKTEVGLSAFVNSLPPGARVASFDIGGISYFSNRAIVDLGGLVDPNAAALLKEGQIWQYVREQRIDYLALPLPYGHVEDLRNFGYRLRLFENPALSLSPVFELQSPLELWQRGLGATWNSSPRQTIFSVSFTAAEGPSAIVSSSHSAQNVRPILDDSANPLALRDRAHIEFILSQLADGGMPTRVVLSRSPPVEPIPFTPEWQLLIGFWGVRVRVPQGESERIADDALHQMVQTAADPALHQSDRGLAIRAALHAVARARRTWIDPRFYPMLPPLPSSSRTGFEIDAVRTWPWGIAWALALVAAQILLIRKTKRATDLLFVEPQHAQKEA